VQGGRVLFKILYWVVVLAISLVVLVALVLFFESRDQSEVEGGVAVPIALSPCGVGA
jgi:hypothetical protein